MDMVCEKEPDCDKDMDEEGLDLEIDGDFISAKGTTLGGDDGIAVAYALAILDDDSLSHPRLEFVCTVCEAWRVLQASMCLCLRERSFLIWTARRRV
jgi:dipeptidase D